MPVPYLSTFLYNLIIVDKKENVKTFFAIKGTLSIINNKGVAFLGNINNVVQRILDELKRQEKKQGDLTTYLDVPKSTFSKWKIGQSQSYKRHIDRIATFLNVSVDYLLGTETEKAPPLSNDDAELLELYSKLTEDDKKFIIKSIKNLNK